MAKTAIPPAAERRRRTTNPVPPPPDQETNARLRRADGSPRPDTGIPAISRTHPRYDEWLPVWKELGHVYEGDGPYLNGDALIPHVRELLYGKNPDGTTDFSNVVGTKRKFEQRKKLARYENFACTIVDLFVDYQYAKLPVRTVENKPAGLERAPIEEWWQDVDGFGTQIDDWFKRYQTLCNVFGHLFPVMDRLPNLTQRQFSITPRGSKTRPTTLADLGRPVLRIYAPPQTPDWLAPYNQLSSVKFREPIERKSLNDVILPNDSIYYIWDAEKWTSYDNRGGVIRSAPHGFGELPARVWYSKRRSWIPIIGRSLLRDGSMFRDHYNLVSELRELFRSQTFSMLNIVLGENETIEQARERLGDHAGTDALVFTKGSAQFIAPPEGPATSYMEEIAKVERKAFRMTSLPWDTDSRDAESAESRRLKAADLNSALASLADNAQELDYWIARAYFIATQGSRDRGLAALKASGLRINHPDEFNTEQLAVAAQDAKSVIDIGVGPTATRLIKAALIPLVLPDLDDQTREQIDQELEQEAARAEEVRARQADDIINGPRPTAEDDNNQPQGQP